MLAQACVCASAVIIQASILLHCIRISFFWSLLQLRVCQICALRPQVRLLVGKVSNWVYVWPYLFVAVTVVVLFPFLAKDGTCPFGRGMCCACLWVMAWVGGGQGQHSIWVAGAAHYFRMIPCSLSGLLHDTRMYDVLALFLFF